MESESILTDKVPISDFSDQVLRPDLRTPDTRDGRRRRSEDGSEGETEIKPDQEAETEDDIPAAYCDEFSTSSGDVSSEYSMESRQKFPSYRPQESLSELSKTNPRYYYMVKLIDFLKGSDVAGTVAVFNAMTHIDLRIDQYIYALEDEGGIEILLNVAETPYTNPKLGALEVLAKITRIPHVQKVTLAMGLGYTAVELLKSPQIDIVAYAAKIIANITQQKFGRTSIRKHHGIPYLVMYADIDRNILHKEIHSLSLLRKETAMNALYCIRSMRNLSKSKRGREGLYAAGMCSVLYDLPNCKDMLYIINALYIFNHCTRSELYRNEFGVQKIHRYMVEWLNHASTSVSTLAGHYLSAVCDNPLVLEDVINTGLLNILLVKTTAVLAQQNRKFFNSSISILYKTSRRKDILDELNDIQALPKLYSLVDVNCAVNTEKSLWEMIADLATYPANWKIIWKLPGLENKLIYNVQCHMYEHVRGSAARIIGLLAHDSEIYPKLAEHELITKLWSLMQIKTPYTIENACRALLPIMKRTPRVSDIVRRLRNGMNILLALLDSTDPGVIAGGILVVAKIIQNRIDLEIVTSMGAIDKIFAFFKTELDPKVKAALCYLIASLSVHSLHSFQLGHDGFIPVVVNYAKSDDLDLKISATYALWKLSEDPVNCIILHANGVADVLQKSLMIDMKDLQTAAGGCLYNIRNLAFNAELRKWLFFNEPLDEDTEVAIKKYTERSIDYVIRKEIVESEVPAKIERKKVVKKKKPLRYIFEERSEEDESIDEIVVPPEYIKKEEKEVDLWALWGLKTVPKL